MNVVDSTTIRIWEGILYPIFLFFSNLIQVLLCSLSHLYPVLLIVSHYCFRPYIPFIYVSFFFFSVSLLSFCFSLYIVSVVTTTHWNGTRSLLTSAKLLVGWHVRIENDGLGFYFIFFSFFIGNKMKKTKCDIITGHMTWSQKSHDHMIQKRV